MRRPALLFLLVLTVATVRSQRNATARSQIATLEVDLSRPTNGIAIPAEVDLDAITFLPDSALELWKVQGINPVPAPFQIDGSGRRTLHWMVDPQPGKTTMYILQKKTKFEHYNFSDSIRAIA